MGTVEGILVLYLICGVVCTVTFFIFVPHKHEKSQLKQIGPFLMTVLIWPLICFCFVIHLLESTQLKWQALQFKREQKKRGKRATKYWQHVKKISSESSKFNRLKLTPQSKLYLIESVEKVCSGKTTWFYYNSAISDALTDFWKAGVELKQHIDNFKKDMGDAYANFYKKGGHISFAEPDSVLHFTDTFEESIREICNLDDRSALSIQLTRLDVNMRQDPLGLVQQCRINDIIPLCKLVINSFSVFFIPDAENKEFYLLFVGPISLII